MRRALLLLTLLILTACGAASGPTQSTPPEFYVDSYVGTDTQRLASAYSAAFSARPSTVVLPNRELTLTAKRDFRPGVSLRGSGSASSIFLDFPGATAPAGNAPYGIGIVRNATLDPPSMTSTFSGFSIRARPTGYYKLVYAFGAAHVTLSNLTFGVAGQSFLEIRNSSDVRGAGLIGRFGGDNSWDRASAKYKIAVVGSQGVLLEGMSLGDPAHNRNQSFVTVNDSDGVIVRDSTFYGTQTYALNTHGTGSTGVVFERNTLQTGTAALYGAILVGNEAWGPDLNVEVRDNTMIGPGRFLQLRAGSSVNWRNNTVPLGTELFNFGPGGGTIHVSG